MRAGGVCWRAAEGPERVSVIYRGIGSKGNVTRAPKLALQIPWTQTAQGAGKAEKLKTSTFVRRRPSRRPAWPLKPNMKNDQSPGGAAENVQQGQKAASLSPNWQIRHTARRCCRPSRRGKHPSRHSQLPRTTTGKASTEAQAADTICLPSDMLQRRILGLS